ncbi:MAG: hypothetical protein GFH27_549281n157 [Chloroflexi bacterium AL-W]|nr:hypothetical protein [Chloroflexi bacterium AL-N1]NOK66043.1 hypothetical protein [Chloroflexi bacterium AL-N10]NOK72924.1 hypothetical protein [Chloroflexi bacterium AL-N5]NOK79821.1 hypothetical protein [Chloroflexi bacterium AL-W]NOK88323.1 hypothetical protein [Chloroflexi bacterium AL-N15]
MTPSDESLRILEMVESGQISAEEGSRLFEALRENVQRTKMDTPPTPRSIRVRVTDLSTHRYKMNVTIPIGLLNVGIKLGARFVPRGSNVAAEQLLRSIDSGVTGRVFEMQDLEEGERIEIFVE